MFTHDKHHDKQKEASRMCLHAIVCDMGAWHSHRTLAGEHGAAPVKSLALAYCWSKRQRLRLVYTVPQWLPKNNYLPLFPPFVLGPFAHAAAYIVSCSAFDVHLGHHSSALGLRRSLTSSSVYNQVQTHALPLCWGGGKAWWLQRTTLHPRRSPPKLYIRPY